MKLAQRLSVVAATILPFVLASGPPVSAQQLPDLPVPPGTVVTPGNARILSEPVVGMESIGFFNSSNQNVQFTVTTGGMNKYLVLLPHEIVVANYPGSDAITGTIGTGAVDTTFALSRGNIYLIAAQAGRWVLRRF